MRRAYFDVGPRAILVGCAPPYRELNLCAPIVSGGLGERLEELAGLPRGHLLYYYACIDLFVRHAAQFSDRGRRLTAGTKLLRSLPGRVLVLLGSKVREACRLEWLKWGRWYDDEGDWLFVCLPDPEESWYNDEGNRVRARGVLEQSRVAALRYGVWDPGGTTSVRTRNVS